MIILKMLRLILPLRMVEVADFVSLYAPNGFGKNVLYDAVDGDYK